MTPKLVVAVLLLPACVMQVGGPPATVDRFTQELETGCEVESECLAMLKKAQERHAKCEYDWACEATKADLKKAQQNLMDFRKRQAAEKAKKEEDAQTVSTSKADPDAFKKPEFDDSKMKKFKVPPPPGCWKNDDGSIGCPPVDEPTGTGPLIVECGVGYGDKPPPGCLQPTPAPKPKAK